MLATETGGGNTGGGPLDASSTQPPSPMATRQTTATAAVRPITQRSTAPLTGGSRYPAPGVADAAGALASARRSVASLAPSCLAAARLDAPAAISARAASRSSLSPF